MTSQPPLELKIALLHPQAVMPHKANPTDACFDLIACEGVTIEARSTGKISLGWAMQLDEGWEARIRGRSGLAWRGIEAHQGTIDHLYRQEVKVILHNLSDEPLWVEPGDRVGGQAGFPSHPGLQAMSLAPDDTPTDGAYLVDSRHVLVDRRCLTGRPRFFHPALYYFAHAFDHAQGGETFSSRKAAAVIACYEASTRAYNGFDFVDELAAADPVRYFARSVAVYLGRDDCDDPLWSHQDLFDFDRSMYDYLQYLFARLNG